MPASPGRRQHPQTNGTTTETPPKSPRTIDVVGTGQVRGTPDVLGLSLGVSTRAHSAGEALSHNSELTHKVIAVLRLAGVDEKDVQTSDLSISPVYDNDGNNIIAYGVTNTVAATLRDLDKAGGIVDAATKVAGDEIIVNSLAFSFDDNSVLVAQARADAVKRAKAQAEQLAKAAGVQLGNVLTISESSTPQGPVVEAAAPKQAAGSSDAAPPIQPGSESLSVSVSLSYEIS